MNERGEDEDMDVTLRVNNDIINSYHYLSLILLTKSYLFWLTICLNPQFYLAFVNTSILGYTY